MPRLENLPEQAGTSFSAAATGAAQTRPPINPVHCDHTRLADVSDLADRITEATRDEGLAAIILAAAVANRPGPRTVDGLDTTLTVNHLTPYLLRERLGPVLAANGAGWC
jgi:hypothetical protein